MNELDSKHLAHLGQRVVDFITRYLSEVNNNPIVPFQLKPAELRQYLAEPLPHAPQGVDAVLDDFEQKIVPHSVRIGHPRFLAWIRSSPVAAAIYAEALSAALNQSVAVWEGAPAATAVEQLVIEWLKEMSGYAPQAGGLLTSGGSMANFTCLLAARNAANPQIRQSGMAGQPPFTVYITHETHYSIIKAAEMLGLGRDYIRYIPMDSNLRMKPDALHTQILQDQQAGFRPMAVIATLGTVNSGACDNLPALSSVCRQSGVWLHVDGAYGGLIHLVPEKRALADGLAEADSLAFDPHKSLFIPFEAGCALVRNPLHLHQTFSIHADYLPNSPTEEKDSTPFHFRDYGPQLTRSFRALKLYVALKTYGVDAFAQALHFEYYLADQLVEQIQSQPDFDLLAPAPLGIVAFRYHPAQIQSEERLNQLNTELVAILQQRGKVFLAGTRMGDKAALRVCFVSHRTQPEDLAIVLNEVRKAAQPVKQTS